MSYKISVIIPVYNAEKHLDNTINSIIKQSIGIIKGIRIAITFIVVSFAWIFFRQPSFVEAWEQIIRIFTNHDLTIHFSMESMCFMSFAICLVVLKEVAEEWNIKWLNFLHSRYVFVRWVTYAFILSCILLMGVFDNSQFIYVNF